MNATALFRPHVRASRGDFDYLNARVRGMSTQLLDAQFYEHVLSSYSDTLFMDALLASPYAGDIRQTLAASAAEPVFRVIEKAAIGNTSSTFSKILSISAPEPRHLIAILLNRWDTANVLTLARALVAGAGPRATHDALLPIGEFVEAQLTELAAERDLDHLAEGLTAWKNGFAFVLRRALLECERPEDPRVLERALNEAYFSWALPQLSPSNEPQSFVRNCIRMHMDQVNIVAALARVRDRALHAMDPDPRAGGEFIARGIVPASVFRELAAADSLETAFEALMGTYFAPGIEKGILAYGQAQSLAVMERFLEEIVLERGCRLFRTDVLGMGVSLGFIWRKYCELANLRLLARGIAYHMPANAIRQELVLV